MHRRLLTFLLAALGGLAPAFAQTAAEPASPPPSAAYRSAFEGYQPFADEKTGSWRDANDATLRAGGWKAYAREAAAAPSPAASAPAPQPAVVDPHAGHHKP